MFVVLGNAVVDEAMAVRDWPTPGHTVIVGPPSRDLGGKGANQALVLRRTGAPVRFVAAVGGDIEGDWVAQALAAEGFAEADLLRVAGTTDRSLVFVGADGENAIASTTEAARSIAPEMAADVVAGLGGGDALLMQGNLSVEATEAALRAARAAGAATVFNPSPIQEGFKRLLAFVDLLVVNEGEAEILGGSREPAEAIAALHALGARTVVMTLGGRGAVGSDGTAHVHVAARRVPVVDTTGAGDTFMGVLVAAFLHRRLGLATAIDAAGEAAAITVQRAGTVAAFPAEAEIDAILRERRG